MHTSRPTRSRALKPRSLKRQRQSEAALRPRREPVQFSYPDPPVWKPLG